MRRWGLLPNCYLAGCGRRVVGGRSICRGRFAVILSCGMRQMLRPYKGVPRGERGCGVVDADLSPVLLSRHCGIGYE